MNWSEHPSRFLSVFLCFFFFGLTLGNAYPQSYDRTTVYQAQQRLKELSYDPGTLDGIWGKKTESAIKRFQHDNNLPVTGRLDSATKDKLGVILSEISGQEKYGFKGIPFGTKWKTVEAKLIKLASKKGIELEIVGMGAYDDTGKPIKLHDYKMGNRSFDIHFSFDHKNRFFEFHISPTLWSCTEWHLRDDLEYLSGVFEKKYGHKACTAFPALSDIDETGYIRKVCYWTLYEVSVSTGVYKIDDKVWVAGMVYDTQLSSKYEDYKSIIKRKRKEERSKAISSGANDF